MTAATLDDGFDFAGISRSVVTLSAGRNWPTCRKCGSSLCGRLETTRRDTDIYRCGCGTRRLVRR